LCFCEPGFDGEQCLGGKQLTATQTAWTGLGSVIIVLGVIVLYRRRRKLEAKFDDDNVTPSDFTVFVQGLPTMSLGSPTAPSEDTAELYRLFERVGPVHFIAPATNDAELVRLSECRSRLLTQLQIAYETSEYDVLLSRSGRHRQASTGDATPRGRRRSAAAFAARAAEASVVAKIATGRSNSVASSAATRFEAGRPLECPLVTESVAAEARRAPPSNVQAARSMSMLIRLALELRLGVLLLCPRWLLVAYLSHVDSEIARIKAKPETYEYNRAFVTFSYADHKWKAVKAFASSRIENAALFRRTRSSIWGESSGSLLAPSEHGRSEQHFPAGLPRQPSDASLRPLSTPDLEPKAPGPDVSDGTSSAAHSTTGDTTGPLIAGHQPGRRHTLDRAGTRRLSWMGTTGSPTKPIGLRTRRRLAGASSIDATPDPRVSVDVRLSQAAALLDSQLPDPASLLFRGRTLSVRPAPEPEEVIWSSLASTDASCCARAALSALLVAALAFGGWYAVTGINESRAGGLAGFFIAGAILALNWIGGFVFRRASDFEQHHATGDKTRWIFIKVLVTQLVVTVAAAVIAVYGYPADGQNRYVQDWYLEAGAFILRTVIVESLVPPLLSLLNIPDRLHKMLVAGCCWKSATLIDVSEEPPQFSLAERCASLMRTVVMAAALAPGMPVLSFFVSAGLFARSVVDSYCMQNVFAMKKSGPQLIRIMELTLFLAAGTNVAMARVILNRAAASSMMAECVFWLFCVGGAWACSGYFSWKVSRARDCCCGTGHILPWSRVWACCGLDSLRAPLEFTHDLFMSAVFGYHFFERYEDSDSALLDETNGVPYHELFQDHGLRRSPYLLFERILLFREALQVVDADLYVMRPMTGAQFLSSRDYVARLLRAESRRFAMPSASSQPPSEVGTPRHSIARRPGGDTGANESAPATKPQPRAAHPRPQPDAPKRPVVPVKATSRSRARSKRASQIFAKSQRQAAMAGIH